MAPAHLKRKEVRSRPLRLSTRYRPFTSPREQTLLSWVIAIWLLGLAVDTLVPVGHAQQASNAVFLFWIVIPMLLIERDTIFSRALYIFSRKESRILPLLGTFSLAAFAAALSTSATLLSCAYLLSTLVSFVIFTELFSVLNAEQVARALGRYASISCVIILYAFVNWRWSGATSRLSLSPRMHVNLFGAFCLSATCAGLAIKDKRLRFLVTATTTSILCIAQSRGAMVAAFVAIAIYFLYTVPWRQIALVGTMIGVVTAPSSGFREELVESLSDLLLLNDRYRGLSSGLSGRSDQIPAAIDLFIRHPAIGNGFRVEDTYLPDYLQAVGSLHNGFIQVIVETGILGAVSMFCLIGLGVYRHHLAARHGYSIDITACATIGGYLTLSMSSPLLVNLANPISAISWMFLLSLIPRANPQRDSRRNCDRTSCLATCHMRRVPAEGYFHSFQREMTHVTH